MIDEDSIKDAFAKVKGDIFMLGNEILDFKTQVLSMKSQIESLNNSLDTIKLDILDIKSEKTTPTDNHKKPAIPAIPTDNPTHPHEIGGLKYPNLDISTRNRGVPTDRQTNQQTDKTDNYKHFYTEKPLVKHISDAQDILQSLDAVKKEIRLKFKQITSQEMTVFSAIYQLESQSPEGVEYRQIALKLQLSESSIRDYVQKLINKGIPVDKIRLNNKKILLKISPKLKNLATLETLIKLREL